MLYDLATGAFPKRREFDFCICGAGPAGITVARKLADKGRSVLLLEGGGLAASARSQQVYECDSTALDMYPGQTRLRFFGGTSNHWAGRCRPFEPSDFARTPPGDLPGWPIGFDAIEPYLAEAMRIVDLDPARGFSPINNEKLGAVFVPDRFALSGPTRFGQKYLEELRFSENISLCVNASATDLGLDAARGSVLDVEVAGWSGPRRRLAAGTFVLAMGAIENARFLLNCNSRQREGIGNGTQMLGRGFMEHLNVSLGEFVYRNAADQSTRQFFTTEGVRAGSGNVTLRILENMRAYGRLAPVRELFWKLSCSMGIEEKVQFISEFNCPGTGVINTLIEQFPDRANAVTLGSKVDAFGKRRASVHWTLRPRDRESIRTIGVEFAKVFADARLGMVRLAGFVTNPGAPATVSPHAHHMGTTRMAADERNGVVDQDCKVFGTRNLFVAGSSIFATGGACNPTMPLLQFGLRLADHLLARRA